MRSPLPIKQLFFVACFLVACCNVFGQLPTFTLTVTPTPQTCLGNGALTFAVSNTVPGAAISYEVYAASDLVNPIRRTSASAVSALDSGDYLVVATQILNGQSGEARVNTTIANSIVDLRFIPVPGNVTCNNNGTITVNVTSGAAVSYEITSGPVRRPLQASNIFTGLPVGVYQVRAYDACGEGEVVTVTLIQQTSSMSIGGAAPKEGALPSCNTIEVKHTYGAPLGQNVIYPLTVEFIVHPPGGGSPIITTYTIQNGNNQDDFLLSIPYYYGQQYSYDIKITDACNNVFRRDGNFVNVRMDAAVTPEYPGCDGRIFSVIPVNHLAPYKIVFTAAPAGFNPEAFNNGHPTFDAPIATYGNEGIPVPLGNYSLTLTDACGHTVVKTFTITEPDIKPVADTEASCGSTTGDIEISIPGRVITSVNISTAPPAYTGPRDVSAYINSLGDFKIINIPLGDYVFVITDDCGETHTLAVTLQPTGATSGINVFSRPGCDEGMGSIRIYADGNIKFESVVIVAAPQAFNEDLPYNVSENISQSGTTAGNFFMNMLPEGDYLIKFLDECGFEQEQPVTVIGYHVTDNEVTIVPHCGSFDIDVRYASSGSYVQSFWLQKYNEATGAWGHPQTGVAYESGLPDETNSKLLQINALNINNPYTGEFRILKFFYTYSNGNNFNYRCMEEVQLFPFDGRPEIIEALPYSCSNGEIEVALNVRGVPPFTYAITSKDGDTSFNIQNGGSNFFSGLEPGNYNFMVTDNCGYVRNKDFDIDEEPPLSITPSGFCEGQPSTLSVRGLTFLNYRWTKQGSTEVLGTSSTLVFPSYNSATQAGVYELQITSQNPLSCLNQRLTYTIASNTQPNAGNSATVQLCNTGSNIDLRSYLGTTFDNGGIWNDDDASGALNGNNFNTTGIAEGTYHFTYTVTGLCNLTDTAIITIRLTNVPDAPVITPLSTVCEGTDVQLTTTTDIPDAIYTWTGPNGFISTQQNPLLENVRPAQAGQYKLTVAVSGCPSAESVVTLSINPLPYAGTDGTAQLCNTGAVINLYSYLGDTYVPGGNWIDMDASNALVNGSFSTLGVAAGIYRFKYEVANLCNDPDEAIVTITLNNVPAVPFVNPVAPLCEGDSLELVAQQVPNALYRWTGPNGFTSDRRNPVITSANSANSGTYSVYVSVNGCISPVAEIVVRVNTLPVFTIMGDNVLCDGQTTELTIVPEGFDTDNVTIRWFLDGILQPDATEGVVEINATGTYRAEVSNGICTASRQFIVSPNNNAFNVDIENGCVNDRYIISISNYTELDEVASVSWTGPGGFSSSATSADITNGEPGGYEVIVTLHNGCSAFANVIVDNTHCVIPRGISPGDGTFNENFDLSNLGVLHIKIFNRYGLQVYEKDNYINEWHGQSDKGDLPTGTYFYVITLSAGKQVTGWVYLLRRV